MAGQRAVALDPRVNASERLARMEATSDEHGIIPLGRQRHLAIALLDALRPAEDPSIVVREDGSIRLAWSTPPGALPREEFSASFDPKGRCTVRWPWPDAEHGLESRVVDPARIPELLSDVGLSDFVRLGVSQTVRMIDLDPAVAERIARLDLLVEERGATIDRRSIDHALSFLEDLGPTEEQPSVFASNDDRLRLVWSTPTGDPVQEQFAVSFNAAGEATVVYSDPNAPSINAPRHFSGGGLVGVEIEGDEVMALMRSCGLEGYVRNGVLPTR